MLKKIITLITITFITSIVSFNALAVPEQGAEPNSNLENKGYKGLENKGLENKGPGNEGHNFKGIDKNNIENHSGDIEKKQCEKCHKDPLKRLEATKEKISKDLKEGKISKEKADELTKKVDVRIAKIKEFNSLSLPEKKQQLSEKFKSRLDEAIKEGRVTKEEGEQLQADFEKQLKDWDGSRPPKPIHKHKRHVE